LVVDNRKRRRKKSDDDEQRKVVMKQVDDSGKLFTANLGEIFGSSEGLEEARKVGSITESDTFGEEDEKAKRKRFGKKRSKRDELSLEEEMFAEEDRGDVRREESEQNIPVDERLKEVTAMVGRSKLRIAAAFLISLFTCFLAVAPHIGITVPQSISYIYHPFIYMFINLAAEIFTMLLCYEVIVTGIRDLVTLKPNMESVVTVSCAASIAHIITVIMFPQWEGYLPFTAVSTLSLVATATCRRKWLVACARSYRTVSGMAKPVTSRLMTSSLVKMRRNAAPSLYARASTANG